MESRTWMSDTGDTLLVQMLKTQNFLQKPPAVQAVCFTNKKKQKVVSLLVTDSTGDPVVFGFTRNFSWWFQVSPKKPSASLIILGVTPRHWAAVTESHPRHLVKHSWRGLAKPRRAILGGVHNHGVSP